MLSAGTRRSELLREVIRAYIKNKPKLVEKIKKEIEHKKITRFFDYCINCERTLDTVARKNQIIYENIEIFELKFCCSCYEQFKDKSFDELPAYLMDKIKRKIKAYKKYMELSNDDDEKFFYTFLY